MRDDSVQNLSAPLEREVIGSVLQRPELLMEIDLSVDEFCAPVWRQTWEAMQALNLERRQIDLFALAEHLTRTTQHSDWMVQLGTAMKDCISPSTATAKAETIRALARERRAITVARELIDQISSKGLSAVDEAVRSLTDIGAPQTRHECSIADAIRDGIDAIDKVAETGGMPGVPTGVTLLDQMLGGLHDGDLVVIGARPSMGKTAFMVNLALAARCPVGVISAEQPREQIAMRMLSVHGRIHAARMRTGSMRDDEWPRLTSASSVVKDMPIRINDRPAMSIADVQRQARVWRHQYGMKALYVDYIQRLKGMTRNIPRHEEVAEIVMGLKELARELGIPVLALSQVNRTVESRPLNARRPRMGDLKDSGAIEQEADVVALLYRDEVYNENSPDAGIAEVIVDKNRHGPTGTIRTAWLADCMRFDNLTTREDYA